MPCARSIAAAGLAHLAGSPGCRSRPAKSNGMAMNCVISLMGVPFGFFPQGKTISSNVALSRISRSWYGPGETLLVFLEIAGGNADGIGRSIEDDADRRLESSEAYDLCGNGTAAGRSLPAQLTQTHSVAYPVILL